ncbi:DNA repair protein RadC [Sneathiella sp.]|uniref:RadC family protein n=1 Tax=Sneathiella sp. TaxID=1964365 RepID=UPI00260D4BFA|nr:DNA repair protein RadC [Sneathiella sp.]MDF2368265.1 DNA repair protein RadC [Sneathiella sp.]
MTSEAEKPMRKPALHELDAPGFGFGFEDASPKTKENDDHRLGHRERMRDRVLSAGARSLADYQILEMLLFAASPRGDTKPLAKSLLSTFGSLAKVLKAEPEALRKVPKVGDAVIATLKVAETLGEKLLRSEIEKKNILGSWQALLEYCQGAMSDRAIEHFRILFLNNKNHLISDEVQQTGTVNHTAVYPREVVKRALELGATALILVHNHPSGDTTPSKADIDMTSEIVGAASALNIRVHDHIIVGNSECISFKSLGLM